MLPFAMKGNSRSLQFNIYMYRIFSIFNGKIVVSLKLPKGQRLNKIAFFQFSLNSDSVAGYLQQERRQTLTFIKHSYVFETGVFTFVLILLKIYCVDMWLVLKEYCGFKRYLGKRGSGIRAQFYQAYGVLGYPQQEKHPAYFLSFNFIWSICKLWLCCVCLCVCVCGGISFPSRKNSQDV